MRKQASNGTAAEYTGPVSGSYTGFAHDSHRRGAKLQAFRNFAGASPKVPKVPLRNQEVSVSKAKQAVSDYKKAVGRPEGLAELSVFYVESCAKLLGYCRIDDAGYFNALVRMFEQALVEIQKLEPEQQTPFVDRLERVVQEGQDWPWDIGDDIAALMVEYGFFKE